MTLLAPPVGSVAVERARRPGTILAVTVVAPLLVLMNYAAPANTLPQMTESLGTGATGQTWILNGIALGLAALLLTAGSLADDYGRKRVLVIGSALMALATAICAVAPTTVVFVLARVVQGGASAALLTSSLGLIGHTYAAGPARTRAISLWGAMIGAGLTLGPLLAGVLADQVSWRATYWVLTGAAALVAAAAYAVLPESRSESPRKPDLPGVAALSLGLAALLAAVTLGRTGWTSPSVLTLFAVAALLLAAFTAIEAKSSSPMLDLGLFRRPLFLSALTGAIVIGLAIIGPMSYMPTILERAHGFNALHTAGISAIWTAVSVASAMLGGRLSISGRHQAALGFILSGAGNLFLLGSAAHWSWLPAAAGLTLVGIGAGLVNAALARLSVESVPTDRASMGSGANNTARYLGGSLGVAGSITIVGSAHTLSEGTNIMFITATTIAALGAALVLTLRHRT
jgi:MFS family permease